MSSSEQEKNAKRQKNQNDLCRMYMSTVYISYQMSKLVTCKDRRLINRLETALCKYTKDVMCKCKTLAYVYLQYLKLPS